MLLFIFAAIVCFLAGLLVSAFVVIREQSSALIDSQKQRDRAQQEVRALTDAIARGNRTPIVRETETPPVLEKSDPYWARREIVEKVSSS